MRNGSGKCFGGATFLHLGWPPGTASRFENGPNVHQYVRDPEGTFPADALAGRYSGNATLPATARDTGFRSDKWRLWVAADGRAAFLVRGGAVERWPWNEQGLACAG